MGGTGTTEQQEEQNTNKMLQNIMPLSARVQPHVKKTPFRVNRERLFLL
jgi:hypothetical protein